MSVTISKRKDGAHEPSTSPYAITETRPCLFSWERHLTGFKISLILTWTLYLLYVVTSFTLALETHIANQKAPWRLYVALAADCLLTFPDIQIAVNFFFAVFIFDGITEKGRKPRPSRRLTGRTGPSVDIMITCCGESVEVILNTVAAAAKQDYPAAQLRVFVLDDGNDEDLRQATDLLNDRLTRSCEKSMQRRIIYLCRKTGARNDQQTHFKSGNLRFGIQASECWEGGRPSEFIAGLDADMIPDAEWLRKVVPHLLVDKNVAIACTPQVSRVISPLTNRRPNYT